MSKSNKAICIRDYEVGYGKPPKHSQWKPGQSGNSKGSRSKESLDMLKEVGVVLRKRVPLTFNGKVVRVSFMGAVIHKMVLDAAMGNSSARRDLFKTMDFERAVDGVPRVITSRLVFPEEENRLVKLAQEVRELTAENARLNARLGAASNSQGSIT